MATINLVNMYDTVGPDAGNVPVAAAKVAGYVTGGKDIIWPAAAWKRFPRSGLVRVDQSAAGDAYAAGDADVYDMETDAGTPARFAQLAAARHGKMPNCGYGTPRTLTAAAAALDAVPGMQDGWWHGAVSCWVADPSLSMAEASKLVTTVMFGGMPCVAVQWATPVTNPGTSVGAGTLKTLNLDLSIALADWFPAAPDPELWQVQALAAARQLEADAAKLSALIGDHL